MDFPPMPLGEQQLELFKANKTIPVSMPHKVNLNGIVVLAGSVSAARTDISIST